ncbi:MAG: phenylalanine--tRNA ligase subunit beta [Lachnospiraceae bacterium]|nr:phenylalanine--tRNA ligase subunit beta [Lachnospiraceae bacterium]
MKITLSWIKSYVPDLAVPAQEFADTMTMSGTKVTGWERTDRNLEKIVIGRVLSCEGHPAAENLTVCRVDTGSGEIQCVTAAENLKPGDLVPVALEGGKVVRLHGAESESEDGVRICRETIRGVESQGVLCSVEELGFTREAVADAPAYAVYVFGEEVPIGADAVKALGLSDVIFTFEPASARRDCFRVVGMAREVAAVFGLDFRAPDVKIAAEEGCVDDYLSVRVRDGVLCPRYCARVVRNVRLGPSPRWMQQRLVSCGIRPVNNLVDITNYVMEELGQPILAFDLESLAGHTLTLERAEDGHQFRTLDGQLRNVDAETLMLCDARRAIGIAGLMGGNSTKVTESGRDIVLEAACFAGAYLRRISRKLHLRTEISTRSARGLDATYAEEGLNRACQLLEQLADAQVVGGMIDECSTVVGSKRIEFHPQWINHHLGTTIPEEEMISCLERLGFSYDQENGDMITPPDRQDVDTEAELAGEIARLYGYDRIPMTIPRVETTRGSFPRKMQIENIARNLAEFHGYSQIMTFSFDDPAVFDRLRLPQDAPERQAAIRIHNPLNEENSILRTTSVGHMLETLALNARRKHRHVRFYELANIYLTRDLEKNELPDERMQFTLGAYGRDDFFDLKGIVEEFLRRTGLRKTLVCDPHVGKPFLHPGRQAALVYDGCVIGYLGEVHPRVTEVYGISSRVTLAVLDLPEIVKRSDFTLHCQGLNRHVRTVRDLSFLVEDRRPAGDIEAALRNAAGPWLEKCELEEVYQGAPLPAGSKSLTYHLRFQAEDRDLSGEEVRELIQKITAALEREGIRLRGGAAGGGS